MDNILRYVHFQCMVFRFSFDCLLIIYRMVYMVLGNFEKKNHPYVRLKWDLETIFSPPLLPIKNQSIPLNS